MNHYDAAEKLKNIRKIDSLIKRKSEQIERLRSISVRMTQNYSDNSFSKNNFNFDKCADIVSRIIDIENEIGHDTERLITLKIDAMKMIDRLDNADMIDVLYLRYLEFKRWEEISVEIGKSLQWVFELNKRAIKKLNDL